VATVVKPQLLTMIQNIYDMYVTLTNE